MLAINVDLRAFCRRKLFLLFLLLSQFRRLTFLVRFSWAFTTQYSRSFCEFCRQPFLLASGVRFAYTRTLLSNIISDPFHRGYFRSSVENIELVPCEPFSPTNIHAIPLSYLLFAFDIFLCSCCCCCYCCFSRLFPFNDQVAKSISATKVRT